MDEYLSITQAAIRVGYCRETIRQAICRDELPARKLAGAPNRPWRIKLLDLLTWAGGEKGAKKEKGFNLNSEDALTALLDESPELMVAPVKRPPHA